MTYFENPYEIKFGNLEKSSLIHTTIKNVVIKLENDHILKCPRCKKESLKLDSLSRRDNKTKICDECGVDEAMFDVAIAQNNDKKKKLSLCGKEAYWLDATAYHKYVTNLKSE